MLKVFHGPFEALEDAFAARVAELRPRIGDAPLLVIAPSRALAERLERFLSVEKGLPLLGVHFHTFHSVAAAIVEDGGFPDGALVSDPLFHDAVVDQVLDEAPSLGIAKELRPRALAAAVRASLRDLVDAGVDPAALAENFGDELLRGEKDERERFIALLSLLAAYEKKLARLKVLPPSALVKRAAELAPGSRWLEGFREVLYYGFYDLTGLQADAFEAVTSTRPSRLYFPYRKNHPAFRFAADFFEQKLASHGPIELASADGAGSALGPALDALFDPAQSPRETSSAVEIISASGARDEAWAAAKEAARLTEEGFAPADIAVVARSLEPYRAALLEAFAAEGLPLALSAGEPILRQPLAKACLDLLSLRRRDFPSRAVEDLASSPYFASASAARVALWRRLIEALGVRAGWLQWRGKLEPRAAGPVELYPHRVREGLPGFAVPAEDVAALWGFLRGVRDSLGGAAAAWSERAEQARALISAHLELPVGASPAESDAWRAVQDALDESAAFDRLGKGCGWDEFLDVIERKLARATRPVGGAALGVRGLDAMDARGQRSRAVILLGLKEKLFPRQVQEDPILRDAARAALRHPGGYWIGRKAAGHEEERLLFYLAAASARERLTLIYPRSDDRGRAEAPSTYLRELCRAAGLPAPGDHDSWRVPRPPAERLRGLAPASRTPAEAALLCALDGSEPAASLEKAGVPAKALAEGFRLAAELNSFGAAGPRDGLVPPPVGALAEWRKKGLAPTALDEFAQCAFKFFAARVLGLGEREEGAERGELSAAARGQVYHEVLERFYASLPEAVWSGKKSPEAHLDAVLEQTFAENDWRELGLYPLLWEASRDAMRAHLHAFVRWDLERLRAGRFRPRLFETKLHGEPAGGAPGGIPWRGVADRIDGDEAGKAFRVADYKTRKSGRWKKGLAFLAADGTSHQIPFYAALAAGALGEGWEFAGGELLFIEGDDQERSAELTAEEWSRTREPFLKGLVGKIEAMSAGRFPISPKEGIGGHCDWCDFPTLCRKSHTPSRERAARLRASQAA